MRIELQLQKSISSLFRIIYSFVLQLTGTRMDKVGNATFTQEGVQSENYFHKEHINESITLTLYPDNLTIVFSEIIRKKHTCVITESQIQEELFHKLPRFFDHLREQVNYRIGQKQDLNKVFKVEDSKLQITYARAKNQSADSQFTKKTLVQRYTEINGGSTQRLQEMPNQTFTKLMGQRNQLLQKVRILQEKVNFCEQRHKLCQQSHSQKQKESSVYNQNETLSQVSTNLNCRKQSTFSVEMPFSNNNQSVLPSNQAQACLEQPRSDTSLTASLQLPSNDIASQIQQNNTNTGSSSTQPLPICDTPQLTDQPPPINAEPLTLVLVANQQNPAISIEPNVPQPPQVHQEPQVHQAPQTTQSNDGASFD